MKKGWYIYCPDCGASVYLARWRWVAKVKFWLLSIDTDGHPYGGGSRHDSLLRCGDEPIECDLVFRED